MEAEEGTFGEFFEPPKLGALLLEHGILKAREEPHLDQVH